MVRSCSAIGCQHREIKDRPDLLFKNLPCDERLKMIWLDKMRQIGKLPKTIVLCSDHFDEHCFERDTQAEMSRSSHLQIQGGHRPYNIQFFQTNLS